jgi:Leucine-rich repeat (LRR) protein
MYGTKVKFLDLSFNSLTTLRGVEKFSNLEELVLDNNKLSDNIFVPYLPNLQTLSLNKNNVRHVKCVL